MHVASIPILLVRALSHIYGRDRSAVESDIADNLYGRSEYIIIVVSYARALLVNRRYLTSRTIVISS